MYGSESWVITDLMMKVLEGFHHHVYHRIVGKMARSVRAEGWVWPPVEETLEAAWIPPMNSYVKRRQSTIEEYITTSTIYELCTGVERIQWTSKMM